MKETQPGINFHQAIEIKPEVFRAPVKQFRAVGGGRRRKPQEEGEKHNRSRLHYDVHSLPSVVDDFLGATTFISAGQR